MAKSKYEYVKHFELDDRVLPQTYMVVRIDGKAFHRLTDTHDFVKPNDARGLRLMNRCAEAVMRDFPEIVLAYGQSDEYSFVFRRDAALFQRRSAKITTNLVSGFAARYAFHWPEFFSGPPWEGDVNPAADLGDPPCFGDADGGSGGTPLQYPPAFDARLVCYPTRQSLRDYVAWRQVDCHINNLYNTCFWLLVRHGHMSPGAAEAELRGTVSKEKLNEVLFTRFGVNYARLPAMYRKGTCLVREAEDVAVVDARTGEVSDRPKRVSVLRTLHVDLVGDAFWEDREGLLE